MTVNWSRLIIEQAEFHWDVHLWPRLQGLTDEEYLWEPTTSSWNVRKGANGTFVMDSQHPAPVPAPVTTIAWRINHLVDNYGARANHFFGTNAPTAVAGTAAEGLATLGSAFHTWIDTVSALDNDAIQAPLGEKGGEYGSDPMAALIVHVAREGIHHGAEICLLRDLWQAGVR